MQEDYSSRGKDILDISIYFSYVFTRPASIKETVKIFSDISNALARKSGISFSNLDNIISVALGSCKLSPQEIQCKLCCCVLFEVRNSFC